MKLKTITTFFVAALLLMSCDNNDDSSPAPMVNGFTFNGTFYETPNAYFEIDIDDDDNNGLPDQYNFFFTDGRMFDNDADVNGSTGDYLYSLNTTKLAFLQIKVADNPSLGGTQLSTGNTYIVSSTGDTVIIHDAQIDPLSPSYFSNAIEFGMGNENVGTFHLPGTVVPTITINAVNLDTTNPQNSSIDVDYTLMNTNGEVITGHYEGTFGVILD